MEQYEVGDAVVIKTDIEADEDRIYRGGCYFVAGMEKYRGLTARIVEREREGEESRYRLDIDDEYWIWTIDMFEPYEEINPATEDELKELFDLR